MLNKIREPRKAKVFCMVYQLHMLVQWPLRLHIFFLNNFIIFLQLNKPNLAAHQMNNFFVHSPIGSNDYILKTT